MLGGLGLADVRFALSGSAPIPAELPIGTDCFGLELLEAYGMTENFAIPHATKLGEVRVGYVGTTRPGVVHKLLDTGELLVKSPGNMLGYYKSEALTREMLDDEGFIHTGDRGEIDAHGRLKITGRVKEALQDEQGQVRGTRAHRERPHGPRRRRAGARLGPVDAPTFRDRGALGGRARTRERSCRARGHHAVARSAPRPHERDSRPARAAREARRHTRRVGHRERDAHADHEGEASGDRGAVRGEGRRLVRRERTGALGLIGNRAARRLSAARARVVTVEAATPSSTRCTGTRSTRSPWRPASDERLGPRRERDAHADAGAAFRQLSREQELVVAEAVVARLDGRCADVARLARRVGEEHRARPGEAPHAGHAERRPIDVIGDADDRALVRIAVVQLPPEEDTVVSRSDARA